MRGISANLPIPGFASSANRSNVKLDDAPEKVKDKFSAILGSGFHLKHRLTATISKKHSNLKAFYAALSEALYAWDDEDMERLYDAILADSRNLEQKSFKLLRYYRRRFFVARVKRYCLPPS